MSEKQPEALRLADWCEANSSGVYRTSAEAAAELRRLHAECEALRADAERLDSGCIVTHERDEFGEEYLCERRGLDLRAAIDAARAAKEQP